METSEYKFCDECDNYTEHLHCSCEACYRRKNKNFRLGDTLAFDPNTLPEEYSLDQKKRYYGDLYDFDNNKPFLFTFICEHYPQFGHCVLINMNNQKVETMRHITNFRLVRDVEC